MTLTPAQLAELSAVSEAEDILFDRTYVRKYGLYGLLVLGWHILCPNEKFVPGWHIPAVCNHAEAAITGNMPRVLMNQPPGSSKSLIMSVLLPAYVWGCLKEPWRKFMYGTYATDVATKDANRSRDFIRSEWFQKRWPVELDGVAQSTYYTTKAGGWRFSEGLNAGNFTGKHPDYLVVDDPVSAQAVRGNAAELKTALLAVQEVWTTVLSSRGRDQNEKIQIVIMQRLHDEDLVGFLLAAEKRGGPHYEHLRIPMYYEADEPCVTRLKDGRIFGGDPRTVDGAPLCPERWGAEALQALQFEQANDWSAQYQQRPTSKSGAIFQRSWFKFWSDDMLRARGANGRTGLGFDNVICSWDFTFKDTRGTDYVCGQVWGKMGPDYFMLDRVYQKLNFPNSLMAIKTMLRKWPMIGAKVIEDKANGPAIISSLEHQVSGLVPWPNSRGKQANAAAVSFLHRAGNVYYPPDFEHTKGEDSHVEQMAKFPLAKHDDSVDAETQALAYFQENRNRLYEALAAQAKSK